MSVTLRKIMLADALDIYQIYSNPKVTYPAGFKPIQSIQETDFVINTLSNNNDYAIVYQNKVIGIIGVDFIQDGIGMLGFLLNENYWHQGLGTQACMQFIHKLKEESYHTLYADCFIDNTPSQKLLLKLGFEYLNDYLRSFSGYNHPQQCHLYKKEL